MGDWLKRLSAALAARMLFYSIVSVVSFGWLGASMRGSWEYLQAAPWPILFLVGAGLFLALLWLALLFFTYLNTPIADGVYGSKYLLWYLLQVRKISWDFKQFLGGRCGQGSPVEATSFQPAFRINWGDGVRPKRAYIECPTTGARQDVLLDATGPYAKAETIEFIPAKKWFRGHSLFADQSSQSGGIMKEAFLQRFDGFRFVFEYDDKVFCKVFSRRDVEDWFDRYWQYCNKSPEPRGRLSGD